MAKARIDMDVMTRRLKNRERQRRYRARKRLEADTTKSGLRVAKRPVRVQPVDRREKVQELSYVSRVHSTRKWKKDARRRAHSAASLEDKHAAAVISDLASNKGSSAKTSRSLVEVASNELNKLKSGRRNWKAEARNKKR